jgi:hypothetical protein
MTTVKAKKALAAGIPIVNTQYIIDCASSGKLLPVETYLVGKRSV